MEFWLVIEFTDHLYTRPVSSNNYSTTVNLHNFQITTAPAKPFPVCYVFTSRSLATASNSGDSSASREQVFSSETPVQNWIINWLARSKGLQDNCSLLRENVYRAVDQKRPWYMPISQLLHSNGSIRYNISIKYSGFSYILSLSTIITFFIVKN
jgi:hypothetical protein